MSNNLVRYAGAPSDLGTTRVKGVALPAMDSSRAVSRSSPGGMNPAKLEAWIEANSIDVAYLRNATKGGPDDES